MKRLKKAFTLVELLVVIAILGVLATVSIVGYTSFTKKADQNNAISELTQIKTWIVAYDEADDTYEIKDGAFNFAVKDSTTDSYYDFSDIQSTIKSKSDNDITDTMVDNLSYDATNKVVEYKYGDYTAKWTLDTGKVEIK